MIVTLVFFMCGVEIVMGLSIFELQCDATDLEPSVGLIGHVKDIVEEATKNEIKITYLDTFSSKKYLNDQGFVQLVNIDHKPAYNSHNCYI